MTERSAGQPPHMTYRFSALLAGACVGLLVGAVILGLMIPNTAPTRIIDVTLRTFLLGALFLFPITFAIGDPTMRILPRR